MSGPGHHPPSSSASTREELFAYVKDMLDDHSSPVALDWEQVQNLIRYLFGRMGVEVTEAYANYLADSAFQNFHTALNGEMPSVEDRKTVVMKETELSHLMDDMMMRPLLSARNAKRCAVLGGGAYGTAIATVLARKGHRVTIVMQDTEKKFVDDINSIHRNTSCFPDIPLHPFLMKAATESDLSETLANTDAIIIAVPVQFISTYLGKHKSKFPKGVPLICVSKGIDAKTGRFCSEVIPTALEGMDTPCAFLAGPSFAIEMMKREPTCVTVAAEDLKLARSVQILFSSPDFRVFTTDDVWGVEVGSALKNVLAIACGVLSGLGYGPNTQMAIVTRGWADIRRLAKHYGAREETMLGLAGIGDVMLTCFGGQSRNSKFGQLLAKTNDVQEAMKLTNSTVEGYFTSFSIKRIARERQLSLPILEAITDMLDGKLPPKLLCTHVMALPLSPEDIIQNPSLISIPSQAAKL